MKTREYEQNRADFATEAKVRAVRVKTMRSSGYNHRQQPPTRLFVRFVFPEHGATHDARTPPGGKKTAFGG
ncbi:MAG: hypothetical protein LBD58_00435 [Treponema sp.]|jgi:hypothetical protein|nr:hypothetical protein [Treponema sp.]